MGGGRGGIPSPLQEDFAFWGLKVDDLVHTLGEFVGMSIDPKLIGK